MCYPHKSCGFSSFVYHVEKPSTWEIHYGPRDLGCARPYHLRFATCHPGHKSRVIHLPHDIEINTPVYIYIYIYVINKKLNIQLYIYIYIFREVIFAQIYIYIHMQSCIIFMYIYIYMRYKYIHIYILYLIFNVHI